MTETDLRNHFYQFREIWTITVVQRQHCTFIQFATRQAAEVATEKPLSKLIVNGHRFSVKWGDPRKPEKRKREGWNHRL